MARRCRRATPRAALAAGVGMVHQHFTLADNLTVLDNILIGTEPLWRWRQQRTAALGRVQAIAQRFGLAVQPNARVGSLSVGERQRVEIVKALYRGARVMILDEPTAVLTPQEVDGLFTTLAQLVAEGLSVIFISHKLDEVLRVSHRVAVLRGGKLVAMRAVGETSKQELAELMVGRRVEMPRRVAADGAAGNWSPPCAAPAWRQPRAAWRCTMSRWRSMRARSSASPGSPATGRSRWPS